MNFRLFLLPAAPLVLALSGCISLDKLPKMPDLPKVKIPFVSKEPSVSANDFVVPYTPKQQLAHGHTLDIEVYAGQRSPSKVYTGEVMVGEDGKADLGKFGKVKLAGLTASQAVRELEAAFRRKRGESIITVQLKGIEGLPLLAVHGAVKQEAVIQYYDGASPANILPYVGGHTGSAQARAVYVTRRGVRAFHADYLNADVALDPGDVVTYSDAL